MAELNHNTIAGALDGLAKKRFSARELAGAHILQMAKHRDLNAYVTDKALEGLFTVLAQEEERIRQDPVARTSALLQKVFAAQ